MQTSLQRRLIFVNSYSGLFFWLETVRVLDNLGLGPEERDGYEAYMEGRALELGMKAGRAALNEQWKMIRRGWYLGGHGYRGRILNM